MAEVVRTFRCGRELVGAFEIKGRFLEVCCTYGSQKVVLGYFDEKRMARMVLAALYRRHALLNRG